MRLISLSGAHRIEGDDSMELSLQTQGVLFLAALTLCSGLALWALLATRPKPFAYHAMILEWTLHRDRERAAHLRLILWSGALAIGVLIPLMFFHALLFVETVQAHGLWVALSMAADQWWVAFEESHRGGGF
jgi:hypothetical protein